MEYRRREDLLDKAVRVFARQPEVREITVFGRNAECTADEYSDLDIRIRSNDPFATQEKYLNLLREISPIRETFLLVSDPDNFAQMIMLRDYTPYQKIDFGICSGDSEFSPTISVYKNARARMTGSKMRVFPIVCDVNYDVTNFLFGVPSITKCFFRKDLDMYRRWQGMTNAALVLLWEKYNGFQEVSLKRAISASEAKRLFSLVNAEDNSMLERMFPRNARLDVVASFLAALNLYVTLSRDKARHFGVALDEEFISYIGQFAREECEKVYR